MNRCNDNILRKYTGLFNDSFMPVIDGVTLTVDNYAHILAAKNYNPYIVTPANPVSVPVPYPTARYFSLPIRSRRPYRYGYPKLDFHIWRRLKETPFRIIHSHSPFSAGRLAMYASRKQGVPLVGTFHSKYRSDLEHSFRHTPWMVSIIMKRILNFFNACDEVWIPQAAVESTVREYGFLGPVTVVENGNDLASMYSATEIPAIKERCRRQLNIPVNVLSLLFVGQHIHEKGIMIIAEALRLIGDNIPYKMHFIGTGYAIGELRKYIKANNLDGKVTVHGNISDRQQLAQHYAAADLFLFPSRYDNAPLVVKESAAMGTPSVLAKGSTAAEVIKEGVNGFTAEATPQAFASLITEIFHNRTLIDTTGKNARQTLTRTWEDVVDEVIHRYDNIIEKYGRI